MKMVFSHEAQVSRDAPALSALCVLGFMPGVPGSPLPLGLDVYRIHSWRQGAGRHISPGRAIKVVPERHMSAEDETAVELILLRIASPLGLTGLPSLDSAIPSRLRDSVQLILTGRLREVHVLLIRGLRLEALNTQATMASLLSQVTVALHELPGALLIFPDLTTPVETREVKAALNAGGNGLEPYQAALSLLRVRLSAWRDVLRDNYQVLLVDAPMLSPEAYAALCLEHTPATSRVSPAQTVSCQCADMLEATIAMIGDLDAMICLWTGSIAAMRTQAWRSASAAVALAVLDQNGPAAEQVLEQRMLRLPVGRSINLSHQAALDPRYPSHMKVPAPLGSRISQAQLHPVQPTVRFEGHSTLRGGAMGWSLPALRTLKELELRLRRAAEAYVFRPVDEEEAARLGRGLSSALADYSARGVLVPSTAGRAMIRTSIDKVEGPSLLATIEGRLRPWGRQIRVDLNVRLGDVRMEST